MEVSVEKVRDALYEVDQNTEAFYLPDLDRFVYVSEYRDQDDIDLEKYDGRIIPLPTSYDINNYRFMEDFIEEKVTGEPHDWLVNAIKGKGAFRRFRETCKRFGLLNDWYKYEDDRYTDIAVFWCEENGLVYYYESKASVVNEDEEEEKEEIIETRSENIRIVPINEKNCQALTYMVVDFRKELAALRDGQMEEDLEGAQEEIRYYLSRKYPIFAASISGVYIGYAVCKVEGGVVWLESIYVRKDFRRKGIATRLLQEAEKVATEYNNDTLYLNIHPNNETVINFLKQNGYDVLNLIEIRKKYPSEKIKTEYQIGDHKYRY